MQTFILISIAFALFLVCPRMAAMMHIITTNTQTNPVLLLMIGAVLGAYIAGILKKLPIP